MKAEPGVPLTTEEIERLISVEMVAGQEYVYGPDNIAAERDRNYDYYRGVMPDLPAAPGRSRVIEPVVANYIGLMKPNLLRIFTSGRNIAEYVSPKQDFQPLIKLITRFINDVVFRKDNRGELMLGDWVEDGLVQKLGVAMWWWEEKWESKDEILENVPDDALPLVAQEIQARGAEIVEHSASPTVLQTPMGAVQASVHALKVRTKVNKSKCCIDVIPPEEFVISRDARNLEDAVLKAHRTGVAVGVLIASGYNPDVINTLPTYAGSYTNRMQKYNQDSTTDRNEGASVDGMLRKVCVSRGIIICDYDGTGLKEWYFVAGGDERAPKLLEIEPYNDQVGFADFCPEPMPHTVIGRCPADRLANIQKVETVLARGMLDSLYLSITPQREVVADWIIKPDQLMNLAPGAPVLVKQPGAIREIAIPFAGEHAMKGLAYYEAQAELTTGVSRNTAGLDPETLSNQSATAAMNQQSNMQGRVEMIARVLAQGGMRKLFRGVFRCIKAYQDFERVVQIDGSQVPVDPRTWEGLDDLDVNINTGLGTGNRERDFMALSAIELSQKEALTQLGPDNPIVDFKKLVRTLQLKCEAAGVSYPENFFADPGDWQPQPPPEPKPTPDTIYNADSLVAIEKIKAESAERKAVAEIASKERIAYREQDLKAAEAAGQLQVEGAKVMVAAAKVDADQIANDMKSKDAA